MVNILYRELNYYPHEDIELNKLSCTLQNLPSEAFCDQYGLKYLKRGNFNSNLNVMIQLLII